ncbi:SH3 domain-containing protein, partial [Algoriphagus sp.]|uniref:SH3 domain-containing protein n=1 Tax=Algoriphagus sp. TaxID=1872435 RepID=UPI0025FDAA1D
MINLLGATIYSAPDLDAQIVGRIDIGKVVYFEKVLDEKSKKQISHELEVEGNWIEIRLDYRTGYIFSSDLTTKPTELIIEHNDLPTLNLFGKELEKKEYTEQTVIDGESYPMEKIVTAYEFALTNETIFDGCFDWEYTLEGFTRSEAYHQVINLHSRKNKNQIEIPAIISREGNVWNFSDLDAIQELKLHDLGNG